MLHQIMRYSENNKSRVVRWLALNVCDRIVSAFVYKIHMYRNRFEIKI